MGVYLIEENACKSPLFVAQAPGPDDVVAQVVPGVGLPQVILCLQKAGAGFRGNRSGCNITADVVIPGERLQHTSWGGEA
jgi:hypothetical protein